MTNRNSILYPMLVCAGVSFGSYLGGLWVGSTYPVEEVVAPIQITEPGKPALQDGYLACTTTSLLYKGVLDNVQCMGTSDLQQYKIVSVTIHSDKTAEVKFDLQDDTTAILWMPREAVKND